MKTITIDGVDYKITPVNTPEPETKPTQLFYPNGSIVYKLKDSQRYWCKNSGGGIVNNIWTNDSIDKNRVISKGVFLTEEACQNADDVDQTHNTLLKKIIEIDAESGWIADWSGQYQDKYWLFWDCSSDSKSYNSNRTSRCRWETLSEQAKNYMMSDKVSNKDFKKFLKIYD